MAYNLLAQKYKPLKTDSRASIFGYIPTKIYFLYSTIFDKLILHNMLYLIKGDDRMKELYEKSLRMIKLGNIKTVKQYNRMTECYQIMNLYTLKYISGTNNFREIIKIAKVVK